MPQDGIHYFFTHRSSAASVPGSLLLLPQGKSALCLQFPFFPGTGFFRLLFLLLLHLQCLLCLCPNPLLHLIDDAALHTLWVDFAFTGLHAWYGWAEFELTPVPKEKGIHLAVPRFCSKRDLADLVSAAAFPFIQSDPERFLKTHGQLLFSTKNCRRSLSAAVLNCYFRFWQRRFSWRLRQQPLPQQNRHACRMPWG